jgi:hypothetical protein
MCSPALTLHNILEGQGDADVYKELLKKLEKYPYLLDWRGNEMQRQLWYLQDLRDGGGLGFTVGLFFLAPDKPLSNCNKRFVQWHCHESESALVRKGRRSRSLQPPITVSMLFTMCEQPLMRVKSNTGGR